MKVALVIIYNHKYEKNIPLLEELYGRRFSHIFHLMPFYEGNKENVIAVYENSYYFQGYIAQAYRVLRTRGDFDHFMFIGDDLLLNPGINENNYKEYFKITDRESYFPKFKELPKTKKWFHLGSAKKYTIYNNGLEIENDMPSVEEITRRFEEKGLDVSNFTLCNPFQNFWYYLKKKKAFYGYKKKGKTIKELLKLKPGNLHFPLIGGYSDLCIISSVNFDQFVFYSGLFAASRLFVELAIPTALVMTGGEIQQEKNLTAGKGVTYWTKKEIGDFEKKYDSSMDKLNNNFPEQTLYIHPVKLSRWMKK